MKLLSVHVACMLLLTCAWGVHCCGDTVRCCLVTAAGLVTLCLHSYSLWCIIPEKWMQVLVCSHLLHECTWVREASCTDACFNDSGSGMLALWVFLNLIFILKSLSIFLACRFWYAELAVWMYAGMTSFIKICKASHAIFISLLKVRTYRAPTLHDVSCVSLLGTGFCT